MYLILLPIRVFAVLPTVDVIETEGVEVEDDEAEEEMDD